MARKDPNRATVVGKGVRERQGASALEGLMTPLSSAPTLFLLMGVGV